MGNYQAIYRKTSKIIKEKKKNALLTYISVPEQRTHNVKELLRLQGNLSYI
jgi:hypothetical protein